MGWAVGLIATAALIYVGFAVARGAPPLAVAFEAGGAARVRGRSAPGGCRGDRRWLAAGWLLHPAWDLLHVPGRVSRWRRRAYVWLCLGFDVVVGLALLRRP